MWSRKGVGSVLEPAPVWLHCMVVAGDFVYVFGGSTGILQSLLQLFKEMFKKNILMKLIILFFFLLDFKKLNTPFPESKHIKGLIIKNLTTFNFTCTLYDALNDNLEGGRIVSDLYRISIDQLKVNYLVILLFTC